MSTSARSSRDRECMPTPSRPSMYGRTYWGALRATFVIGSDGVVARVIPR